MMLPTFVIGLREGLEASLIVGIVAAFLNQRGRHDLLRLAMLGVLAALTLCVAAGVGLEIVSRNLPQRQQEGLETVVGAVAVCMVTYMVLWMRRHARDLRGQLEGAASDAVASGSGLALVAMAFLAVLREGLETVVFLLAAFNESSSGTAAGVGAALGIVLAVGLGYGIYRGGVHINLSKFFRATGLVLVLVAAGLVATALHTAHEAGWLNIGQQGTVDLSAVVRPGSVQSSLLTGILGIVGWALYVIPLGFYVLWPSGRSVAPRLRTRLATAVCVASVSCAAALLITVPSVPVGPSSLSFGAASISKSATGVGATVSVTGSAVDGNQTGTLVDSETHAGRDSRLYLFSATVPTAAGLPSSATPAQVAALNGGRLPLGAGAADGTSTGRATLSYTTKLQLEWWVDTASARLIDVRQTRSTSTTASFGSDGQVFAIGNPRTVTSGAGADAVRAAVDRAGAAVSARDSQGWHRDAAIGLAALAVLSGIGAAASSHRRHRTLPRQPEPHVPSEPLRHEAMRS
jgi:high-affinity iron transporter